MNIITKYTLAVFLLLISISINSSVSAKGLAKPSSSHIIRIIKTALNQEAPTNMVGILSFGKHHCINPSIKHIKLLKIGRSSSNYYESSGNYINSEFYVKFTIQGSCELSTPYIINDGEVSKDKSKRRRYYRYHPNGDYNSLQAQTLSGRLPFRNIPFDVLITTDRYGDWVTNKNYITPFNESDRVHTDKTKNYIKALYEKRGGYKQATRKPDENNKAYLRYKKIEKKYQAHQAEKRQRGTNLKQRVAAIKKAMVSREDLANFKKLKQVCSKNKWSSCYGYIPNCYTKNGKKYCPSTKISLSDFENFYVPLVRAQKRYHGKIIKDLAYGHKGGARSRADIQRFDKVFKKLINQYPNIKKQYNLKPRAYKNTFWDYLYYQKTSEARRIVLMELAKPLLNNKSITQIPLKKSNRALVNKKPNNTQNLYSPLTDNKRVNEILSYFKRRPKALKAFYTKNKAIRFQLFKRIYERNTPKERYQAFLQVAKSLEAGGKSNKPNSNRHSHGGRFHSHRLPKQGKAHRHGNGPLGR